MPITYWLSKIIKKAASIAAHRPVICLQDVCISRSSGTSPTPLCCRRISRTTSRADRHTHPNCHTPHLHPPVRYGRQQSRWQVPSLIRGRRWLCRQSHALWCSRTPLWRALCFITLYERYLTRKHIYTGAEMICRETSFQHLLLEWIYECYHTFSKSFMGTQYAEEPKSSRPSSSLISRHSSLPINCCDSGHSTAR